MIIIAVSGWRGFVVYEDRAWIENQLVFWSHVLSSMPASSSVYWRFGDEPDGCDSVVKQWLGVDLGNRCEYKANWSLPYKAGGPVRSMHMLLGRNHLDCFERQKADYLLAFPQPGKRFPRHEEVSGTFTCIQQAKRYGITTIMPGYTRPEPEGLF